MLTLSPRKAAKAAFAPVTITRKAAFAALASFSHPYGSSTAGFVSLDDVIYSMPEVYTVHRQYHNYWCKLLINMSKSSKKCDMPCAAKRPRISELPSRRLTAADVAKMVMEASSDSDFDAESNNSDGMETEEEDVASNTGCTDDTGNSDATNVICQSSIVVRDRDGSGDLPVSLVGSRTTGNKAPTDQWTWTNTVKAPATSFKGQSGFRNMPESLGPDSKMIDFFNLFLDNDFIQKMVDSTNLRASQTMFC